LFSREETLLPTTPEKVGRDEKQEKKSKQNLGSEIQKRGGKKAMGKAVNDKRKTRSSREQDMNTHPAPVEQDTDANNEGKAGKRVSTKFEGGETISKFS